MVDDFEWHIAMSVYWQNKADELKHKIHLLSGQEENNFAEMVELSIKARQCSDKAAFLADKAREAEHRSQLKEG